VNAPPEQSTRDHEQSGAAQPSPTGRSSFAATSLHHGRLPRWFPGAVLVGVSTAVGGILGVTGFSIPTFVIVTAGISWLVIHVSARVVEGRRKALDRTVTMLVTAAFLAALLPLVSVLYTVVSEGIDRFDVELFTFSQAGIISSGAGGVYHAIIGTLVTTGLATLISVPIGILTAIYLVEYGRGRLKTALTVFVDIMVGIPSIVAGLFAYAVFALLFGPGVTFGAMGSVALAVLMIPIVVRSTEEMLRVVPTDLREAALALGVPTWRVILRVVLPTAAAGIASGVTLAIARIVGETAPLLVTVGLAAGTNWNPFDGPMATLSVFAYDTYQNPGVPQEPSFDLAWSAALLLIIIVLVLNLAGRLAARFFSPRTRN